MLSTVFLCKTLRICTLVQECSCGFRIIIMMKKLKINPKRAVLPLLCVLYLSGCAGKPPIYLDSHEHFSKIESDRQTLYPNEPMPLSGTLSLTLEQAIDRALQNNLDGRVAAMESLIAKDNINLAQFKGMPNITASGTFTRRNDDAASSSKSILTGTQSLQPSTSAEQVRRLSDLQAQWNIMDSVIAYLDGKSAGDQEGIAKERLKKVRQNIQRDVVKAYWQAFAGQQSKDDIDILSKASQKFKTSILKADKDRLIGVSDMNDRLSSLQSRDIKINDLNDVSKLANVELKAISAIPFDQNISLESKPIDVKDKFKISIKNNKINDFIHVALKNRSELREEYLKTNISIRNTQQELIKTFPGLNLIYSKNYDSNSFLNNHAWSNFSGAITQSISDFISLPTRYRASKNQEELTIARRKALTAAIIAQVHIGKIRINMAKDHYEIVLSQARQAKRQAFYELKGQEYGSISGFNKFLAQADTVTKDIEKYQAFATLQQAYVDMMGTLGLSIYNSEVKS